jgi:hypothetical protein
MKNNTINEVQELKNKLDDSFKDLEWLNGSDIIKYDLELIDYKDIMTHVLSFIKEEEEEYTIKTFDKALALACDEVFSNYKTNIDYYLQNTITKKGIIGLWSFMYNTPPNFRGYCFHELNTDHDNGYAYGTDITDVMINAITTVLINMIVERVKYQLIRYLINASDTTINDMLTNLYVEWDI